MWAPALTAEVRLTGESTVDTVHDLSAERAALIRTGHHRLTVDAHRLAPVEPIIGAFDH